MAALTASVPAFPDLEQALRAHDFQKSQALYNSLKDDEAQPEVSDEHIRNLADLFVRHNAADVFGIHLIHGHFQIPKNIVMVGTNFQNPDMRWCKTIGIDNLEQSSIHGHVFVLTDGGFRAYEFQDGPLPDLTHVKPGFLEAFSRYIVTNYLDGVVGLQVLGGCGNDNGHGMSELILEQGTVMLDSSLVKDCEPTRVTGWAFETSNGTPRSCASNETHSKMTTGNHKVFNAGKPLPKLDNVEDLKAALVEAGVL